MKLTWNRYSNSFAEFYPFGNQNQITSGDFNGDGYLDLLMANYAYYGFFGSESDVTAVDQVQAFYGGAQLSQFGNNSKVLRRDFPSVLTSSAQLSTALGDVNADGYDDILLSQIGPGTQASLLLGDTSNPLETSIAVQGLPNRRTVYQQGTAGDINGDGYNDLLMSDFDYKLTYAIYGQDWLTETEQNSNPATYTFFDGTNGNDVFTIPENVSTPKIVLRGQNGDDYMLIPAANSSQIYAFGGEGDDQIGLGGELGTDSEVIGKIDGGGGFDTIFIPQTVGQQTRLYLDAKTGYLTSIEAIDIGYNNSVQFNQSTLLHMLDGNKKLFINGVNSTVYNSGLAYMVC